MILLLVWAALSLVYVYVSDIDYPSLTKRITEHDAIVGGTAPGPYRYRILLPLCAEILSRGPFAWLSRERALFGAYATLEFGSLTFTLVMIWQLSSTWFSRTDALLGAFLVALLTVPTFRNHFYQPWSLAEPGFNALFAYLIVRERHLAAGITLALSCVNRETGIFAALLALPFGLRGQRPPGAGWPTLRALVPAASFPALGVVVLVLLRVLLGTAPHVNTPERVLAQNLEPHNLAIALVNFMVCFGPLVCLAGFGWSRAPTAVRRLLFPIPIYVAALLVWSFWTETRTWTALFPYVLPCALAALSPIKGKIDDSFGWRASATGQKRNSLDRNAPT
jgi:hypothetical protein